MPPTDAAMLLDDAPSLDPAPRRETGGVWSVRLPMPWKPWKLRSAVLSLLCLGLTWALFAYLQHLDPELAPKKLKLGISAMVGFQGLMLAWLARRHSSRWVDVRVTRDAVEFHRHKSRKRTWPRRLPRVARFSERQLGLLQYDDENHLWRHCVSTSLKPTLDHERAWAIGITRLAEANGLTEQSPEPIASTRPPTARSTASDPAVLVNLLHPPELTRVQMLVRWAIMVPVYVFGFAFLLVIVFRPAPGLGMLAIIAFLGWIAHGGDRRRSDKLRIGASGVALHAWSKRRPRRTIALTDVLEARPMRVRITTDDPNRGRSCLALNIFHGGPLTLLLPSHGEHWGLPALLQVREQLGLPPLADPMPSGET